MPAARTLSSTAARAITLFRCGQCSATVPSRNLGRFRRRSLRRNLEATRSRPLFIARLASLLGNAENRAEIAREFPKKSIHRRNTGYAIDSLAECSPFVPDGPPFNFCRLLAGSEGTLAFLTEITLSCEPLPPRESALVCVHCATIDEALRANLVALRHSARACELMDDNILECTKVNIEQRQNRFFVQGDPGAILAVELAADTREEVVARAAKSRNRVASRRSWLPLSGDLGCGPEPGLESP